MEGTKKIALLHAATGMFVSIGGSGLGFTLVFVVFSALKGELLNHLKFFGINFAICAAVFIAGFICFYFAYIAEEKAGIKHYEPDEAYHKW